MSAYTDRIAAQIAAALTDEQLDKLAVLLRPQVQENVRPLTSRRAA
ncbi:hypothetical protein [Georgenia sp. AZ-5]